MFLTYLAVGTPVTQPPRTDPDVPFSRIRFLGRTHFRADLHSLYAVRGLFDLTTSPYFTDPKVTGPYDDSFLACRLAR